MHVHHLILEGFQDALDMCFREVVIRQKILEHSVKRQACSQWIHVANENALAWAPGSLAGTAGVD